jgi:hypothetical protein
VIRSTRNDHTAFNGKLCDIKIAVCWQDWRDITEELAVDMNKGGHDVGLRKQQLGYHNNWDCWYFILLVLFGVLHPLDVRRVY